MSAAAPLNPNQALVAGATQRPDVPAVSFSGTDCHITAFIPPNPNNTQGLQNYKKFGEMTTITMSSFRGISPVRALGEHWVRDFSRGTRSFAGTLVFSVLEKDVFAELYSLEYHENRSPFPAVVDQIPPFTIGIHSITEFGQEASMFLWGVRLTNWGMAVSVEDLYVETTYNYVAQWVTPFLPGKMAENMRKLTSAIAQPTVKKASDLYTPTSYRTR